MTALKLLDPTGRPVNDLRISLTPACDLACTFCHREGMADTGRLLGADELQRICAVAARLGVRHVKLTGGEPLLRPDVVDIVRRISGRFEGVSLVTNGRHLESLAQPLRDAGLARVNVSLHTLDPAEYRALTGGELEPVLRGIRAAVRAGLDPVKANVVFTADNQPDVDRLVAWAASEGVTLQLIEVHAPPGARANVLSTRVPLEPLEETLAARATRIETHPLHGRKRFLLDGTSVEVTRPHDNPAFCSACTRMRLTHDGWLKPCLMRADNHVFLGDALRRGDEAVASAFREATRRRVPYWQAEVAPLAA